MYNIPTHSFEFIQNQLSGFDGKLVQRRDQRFLVVLPDFLQIPHSLGSNKSTKILPGILMFLNKFKIWKTHSLIDDSSHLDELSNDILRFFPDFFMGVVECEFSFVFPLRINRRCFSTYIMI